MRNQEKQKQEKEKQKKHKKTMRRWIYFLNIYDVGDLHSDENFYENGRLKTRLAKLPLWQKRNYLMMNDLKIFFRSIRYINPDGIPALFDRAIRCYE